VLAWETLDIQVDEDRRNIIFINRTAREEDVTVASRDETIEL